MSTTFDGRTLRKNRGVDQMLFAGLILVQRGNWRPTAKEISAQSGVSIRTFFTHFGTVEDYYKALFKRHESELYDCLRVCGTSIQTRIAITGWASP